MQRVLIDFSDPKQYRFIWNVQLYFFTKLIFYIRWLLIKSDYLKSAHKNFLFETCF